jgi:hypothetical protein
MLTRIGVLLAATTALAIGSAPAHAATLRAPAPQSPAPGASVDSVPPFTWGAVGGAAWYEFQVAADRGFGSIVKGGAFRTRNTAATLRTALADGTYHWRVRAIRANDKAGRWSNARAFDKSWTTTPELLEPGDALSIQWPARPLILRWSVVPHATKYQVTVATDPSLAKVIVGGTKPVETQGTVLAVPGSLAPGNYYWAVTPIDQGNFKGRRSRVGTFSWEWPTASRGRVLDLDPAPEVFDPLLQWDTVPGAAKYDVEVNPTSEFTPGSRVFAGTANGTSISPTVHLLNNTYQWRVRAVDADGNAGAWNVGPPFKKEFDDVTPTVRNVRIRDHDSADLGAFPTTPEPFFTWDPVPGATQYELQFTRYSSTGGGFCDWSARFGDTRTSRSALTVNNAWAVGSDNQVSGNPGTSQWPALTIHKNPFDNGQSYCMRILAVDGATNTSEWTYVNSQGNPTDSNGAAFTYVAPSPPPPAACAPVEMPAGNYREPAQGAFAPRTPFFTWDPVGGAASYFVVVARDAEFTEVIDFAYTRQTIYAPRKAYADETTSYYWAIIPAGLMNGTCTDTIRSSSSFQKRSQAPELLGPANGENVPVQPFFRWTGVESAAKYRLQVSADPEFGQLLEDTETASTAFTSAKTFPVDTGLYWRVRANALNWSEVRSFRRRLPVPGIPDNPTGGETIPVLGWDPVEGAIGYDMHVDQADGTQRDFTMRATRFTPILFYGTGVWRWKVRAMFPGNARGAYSDAQPFVRRLNAPQAVKVSLGRKRMLFTWNPDQAASTYRLQISESDSFGQVVDNITTPLTSFAPLLSSKAYTNGGRLWWRLAVVDAGSNVGAYTTGIVALPRAMKVTVKGRLARGRRGVLRVTALDAKGRAIRKAAVTVSGAGASGRKRTGKMGVAKLRVRPRSPGTVTIRVVRRGFETGVARVLVG